MLFCVPFVVKNNHIVKSSVEDILHEKKKEIIYQDILTWILKQI